VRDRVAAAEDRRRLFGAELRETASRRSQRSSVLRVGESENRGDRADGIGTTAQFISRFPHPDLRGGASRCAISARRRQA
jgi:hypothetical protein